MIFVDSAVIILAGGLSTRMKTNKLRIMYKGMPMLSYTLNRLKKLSLPTYVITHSQYDLEREDGLKYIEDIYSEPRTPLLGMLSAFKKIPQDRVFVTTADSPEINPKVVSYMLDYTTIFSSVIPTWESGKPEIIHAAYRRQELLPILEEIWKKNIVQVSVLFKLAPDPLFISTEHLKALDPNLTSFIDFDTPEDLERFLG